MTSTRISGANLDGASLDRSRPRRSRRVLVAAGLALALVVAGAVIYRVVRSCDFGSGVSTVDGQCIGVTDGSFVFDDRLRDIQRRILKENERVRADFDAAGTPYVRVALLMPMTADATSAMQIERVRYSLQGAYLGQVRANRSRAVQDPVPQVELLLANEGDHQAQWRPVVEQLAELADDDDHPLRTVVGLGVSIPETYRAAEALARHRIPMVGAVLTATTLNYDGLIKVSASNESYIEAISAVVSARPDLGRAAALVYDKNDDPYVNTLKDAFESHSGLSTRIVLKQDFTGTEDPGDATPALFYPITQNICLIDPRPDLIYFAGRVVDLTKFAESLAHRPCGTQRPVTIVTGATGLSALGRPEFVELLRTGNIAVVHASATDHGTWIREPHRAPPRYAEFLAAFRDEDFDEAALWDGYALMHHDAVVTAVKAVRAAGTSTGRKVPKLADVRDQLGRLNGINVVPAASGDLTFAPGSRGWPGGKTIPVVQVPVDARPSLPAGTPFITVAS
jgi:hypothetical protein